MYKLTTQETRKILNKDDIFPVKPAHLPSKNQKVATSNVNLNVKCGFNDRNTAEHSDPGRLIDRKESFTKAIIDDLSLMHPYYCT